MGQACSLAHPLLFHFILKFCAVQLKSCCRFTIILASKKSSNNGVCSAVFLDDAQPYDRVWHRGLLRKLRSILPDQFYQLMKFYLTNQHFCVKHEDS
jgi:hypothetical protein